MEARKPGRTWVMVTGASRGFGEAAVCAIAEGLEPRQPMDIVIVSRDASKLAATCDKALALAPANSTCAFESCNLADGTHVERALSNIALPDPAKHTHCILLNNAGSLYRLDLEVKDYADFAGIQNYMALNVTSMAVVTGFFLKHTRCLGDHATCLVANVSSLLAVKAFPNWGAYAMGKAARDMLLQVVAEETKASNVSTKTVNWAPGPMRTVMMDEVCATVGDTTARGIYNEMKDKGTLVDPRDSANKMVRLLNEDRFESGTHWDYYDDLP